MSAKIYMFDRLFTISALTPISEIVAEVKDRGWYSFEMKPNLDAGTVTLVRVSEAKATRTYEEIFNATLGDTS